MTHLFMKKTCILTAIIASASLYCSSETLYSTQFLSEDEFQQWTVVDVNNDAATWGFSGGTTPSNVFYSYNVQNGADDWLISPAITATQDGFIAMNFTVYGSSYGEKLEVFYGEQNNPESMTTRATDVLYCTDSNRSEVVLIPVTAGQNIHIGFHACSDADKWRLYLCEFIALFTTNPADIGVQSITSPISGKDLNAEDVTIVIKNNNTTDISNFQVAFSIDDVTISTESIESTLTAGTEMTYTFQAKADLSTPRKLYTIKAWTILENDINPSNDATTANILHEAPATVPYFMGFESNEYTDGIRIFDLNNDSGNWDIYTDPWWNLARTGDYCLAYNYNRDNDAADWAILEPINVEAGYYALKFWYSGDDTHPEKLALYYGNECSPQAMTNKVVEYAPFARSEYAESINIIHFEEAQTVYFGFYAFSDKDENWICIDDISIEKISSENLDLAVTEISAPQEYVRSQSNKDITFNIRSLGITDTDATITVSIDDQVISSLKETILAQENKAVTITDALLGVDSGKHTIKVEVSSGNDNNNDNNIITSEFIMLGAPTLLWDFETGQLPSDFTFRAEDEGTNHPSAGAEFNEDGWGIFNIQNHSQLGEHVMAGNTWLEGTEQADRWCILPSYNVTVENTYFVWDAMSFNQHFPEHYSIMISTNGDDNWYYFTETEITLESPYTQTRGFCLDEYIGKEIFIAFRLKTKNGECLILDNIGIYDPSASGIEDVVENTKYLVTIADGKIKANGDYDIYKMTLHELSGREVAQSNNGELTIEGLTPGIYVATITGNSGTQSMKIAIK